MEIDIPDTHPWFETLKKAMTYPQPILAQLRISGSDVLQVMTLERVGIDDRHVLRTTWQPDMRGRSV